MKVAFETDIEYLQIAKIERRLKITNISKVKLLVEEPPVLYPRFYLRLAHNKIFLNGFCNIDTTL